MAPHSAPPLLLMIALGVLLLVAGVDGQACDVMAKTLSKACGTKLIPAFPLQGSVKMCDAPKVTVYTCDCKADCDTCGGGEMCTDNPRVCTCACNVLRGKCTGCCVGGGRTCVPKPKTPCNCKAGCTGCPVLKARPQVPCGASLKMSETDLCGGASVRTIARARAVCRCQSQAAELVGSAASGAADDPSGPVTGATSATLSSYAKVAACTVDAGLAPSDNRAAQLAAAGSGGWTLLMGPEIDLKAYIDVASRITACGLGKCDDLTAWLLRYLKDFKTTTAQQLSAMLRARLLAPLEQAAAAFTSADAALAAAVDGVGADAAAAVATLRDAAKALETIAAAVRAAAAAADATAAAAASPAAVVSQLVAEGRATSLTAITDLMSAAQALPGAAKALEKLPTLSRDVSRALASLKARAADASAESNAALQELLGALSALERAAASLGTIRRLDVASAVVTYSRHASVSLSLPCELETSRQCLRISGEQACANVPSLKLCDEKFKIPLPNHHIPVIKVRLA